MFLLYYFFSVEMTSSWCFTLNLGLEGEGVPGPKGCFAAFRWEGNFCNLAGGTLGHPIGAAHLCLKRSNLYK